MAKSMINLIPGPVSVPDQVLQAMSQNFGSGDLDEEFLILYNQTEKKLQTILGTRNQVLIQTGEGMWGLWGALKSTLKPGDHVVSVCTGVFGYGIAEMAAGLGADVRRVELDHSQTLNQADELCQLVAEHKPVMITAVHCETPSGTLNPLDILAQAKKAYPEALLCVDTVASAGGCAIDADYNQIDLALNGSQKALSAPPSMSFVSVSDSAWARIAAVNYSGYDAFLPFKYAQCDFYFPNTPYWHGVAALNSAAKLLLQETLPRVFARHEECQKYCEKRVKEMGLKLFAAADAVRAPTVTAVCLPEGSSWTHFKRACNDRGLAIAGGYGKLSGKVFRIGHMGNQARMDALCAGLDIIQSIV